MSGARRAIPPLLCAAVGLGLGACASEASKPACAAASTATNSDLMTPKVSFQADVVPVLAQGCAFSSCHGASHPPVIGKDPAKWHAVILSAESTILPTMPLVTPGDPAKSFLMHKLDGDQCLFDSACKDGDCRSRMPLANPPLPGPVCDVVRRWIVQGAGDD